MLVLVLALEEVKVGQINDRASRSSVGVVVCSEVLF